MENGIVLETSVWWLIDISRISVKKGTNSRFGWTKFSDLHEIVGSYLGFW